MKRYIYILLYLVLLTSCSGKDKKKPGHSAAPAVSSDGQVISFPDTLGISFFKTEVVSNSNMSAELTAPAKVAATVVASGEGASRNIVLFESPDLASSYTQLIQHQINIAQKVNIIAQKRSVIGQKNAIIKQRKNELERFKDLAAHGAGTGKDVADAQTDLIVAETDLTSAETDLRVAQNELANEQTAIIEHEAALKTGGFNPKTLLQAPAGRAYIICDLAENQVSKIKEGNSCVIQLSAFPAENFPGTIEDIADVVNNITRMISVRISVANNQGKLRAGMYAAVSFGINEGNYTSVNRSSLVTVQGKDYAFVKKTPLVFERRALQTGQQIGDRIIVFNGLNNGDAIAVQGVMQLKGLSFGY